MSDQKFWYIHTHLQQLNSLARFTCCVMDQDMRVLLYWCLQQSHHLHCLCFSSTYAVFPCLSSSLLDIWLLELLGVKLKCTPKSIRDTAPGSLRWTWLDDESANWLCWTFTLERRIGAWEGGENEIEIEGGSLL